MLRSLVALAPFSRSLCSLGTPHHSSVTPHHSSPQHSSPPSPSLLALGRKLPRPPLLAIVVTPHLYARLRVRGAGVRCSLCSLAPLQPPTVRSADGTVRTARRLRPAGGYSFLVRGCHSFVARSGLTAGRYKLSQGLCSLVLASCCFSVSAHRQVRIS